MAPATRKPTLPQPRDFPCPDCHAAAGKLCRSARGKAQPTVHTRRLYKAQDAYAAMKTKTPKPSPYTSDSLAVSRRMIAPGPFHEEQAIIYDLQTRKRHLDMTLKFYDRGTGKPIADEAARLHAETWRRIEQLPEGELRTNLTREMYRHDR